MIWAACERLGILPPGCYSNWNDMSAPNQAMVIAYAQIREYEEAQNQVELMKASALGKIQ